MMVKARLATMPAVYIDDPNSGLYAGVAGITDAAIPKIKKFLDYWVIL